MKTMNRLSHLYAQYWNEVCRVVRRKFGAGPPDPEEAAQFAFERLTTVSETREIEHPRAFLHRCASNYVINQKRHHAVQGNYAREYSALNDEATPDEFDAQRVLEARERLRVVMAAVEGLEEKRRKILLYRQMDDLTFGEIARKMNLSHTRVVQLFTDALAQCVKAARDFEAKSEDTSDREGGQ